MSHPAEDKMVLLNSKEGVSFKVITKNEQLPCIPLEICCPLFCNFMQVMQEAAICSSYLEEAAICSS